MYKYWDKFLETHNHVDIHFPDNVGPLHRLARNRSPSVPSGLASEPSGAGWHHAQAAGAKTLGRSPRRSMVAAWGRPGAASGKRRQWRTCFGGSGERSHGCSAKAGLFLSAMAIQAKPLGSRGRRSGISLIHRILADGRLGNIGQGRR